MLDITWTAPLCSNCERAIKTIDGPLCYRCGAPFRSKSSPDHLCGQCIKSPPPWERAISLYRYYGVIRSLIHAFKFKDSGPALRAIEWICRPVTRDMDLRADIFVPMPLSPKKLRRRGFNQALLLLSGILPEKRDRIRISALKKVKDTPSQVGLSKKERLKNVRGTFSADKKDVEGKDVLLFDDIFTTGATCHAATIALKKAGARQVTVLTLARTIKDMEEI